MREYRADVCVHKHTQIHTHARAHTHIHTHKAIYKYRWYTPARAHGKSLHCFAAHNNRAAKLHWLCSCNVRCCVHAASQKRHITELESIEKESLSTASKDWTRSRKDYTTMPLPCQTMVRSCNLQEEAAHLARARTKERSLQWLIAKNKKEAARLRCQCPCKVCCLCVGPQKESAHLAV